MTTRPFTVADVMTKKVVAVRPGAEFKEIVAAMERWKVTAVPVVEGEGRVDGGVVTLSGEVRDGARIPIAERLARAVEGVVDVRCELTAQGVGGDER